MRRSALSIGPARLPETRPITPARFGCADKRLREHFSRRLGPVRGSIEEDARHAIKSGAGQIKREAENVKQEAEKGFDSAKQEVEHDVDEVQHGKANTDALLPFFAVALGVAGLAKTFAAQQFSEFAFGVTPTSYSHHLLQLGGPFLLLGGVSFFLLQTAAQHGRLGSDTYQRLGVSTLAWYAGLVALYITHAGLTTAGWVFAASGVAAVVTIWRAYTRGPGRSQVEAAKDAVSGLVSSVTSLTKVSNLKSGLWAAATVALGLFGLKLLLTFPGQEGLGHFLVGPNSGTFPQFQVQVVGTHLLLAAATAFNLKDAAERDRIDAGTFQTLSKTLAGVSALASWQLARLAPAAIQATPNLNILYRVFQVVVAAVGVLSLASIDFQGA